jgi:hypothetical protein
LKKEAFMAFLTLEEAKTYLRVDSDFEDGLIASLASASESLCMDVARLSAEEWEAISEYSADNRRNLTIRFEEKSKAEVLQMKELLRVGVLYALGYLYEHREDADHHALTITLRSLLFGARKEAF